MEQLPQFGTAILQVAPKTFGAYAPLLVQNQERIRSTRRETATYGPHPRQALDVYHPANETIDSPILIFCYGGGLVRGSKTITGYADDLVLANVGHFFADKLGYITVIPDYRLISHGAKFPSGGEDVARAVEWVQSKLVKPGQSRELLIMGNSAGGVHTSTFLFSPVFAGLRPSILPSTASSLLVLKGVVLLSVPFHFREASPDRAEILKAYFGDRIEEDCPLGLFVAACKGGNAELLPGVGVLVLNGRLDPENEILGPKEEFIRAWRSNGGSNMQKRLEVGMMEGHNHISPPLSLGLDKGNEEAWGYQVGKWFDSLRL